MSQGTSQGKVVKHVVIGLRTTKGTKQLKLDPSIYDGLQREKVNVGDVIYIEASSGAVRRVGRCDTYATEYDLEAEEYVPMPKVCHETSPNQLSIVMKEYFVTITYAHARKYSRSSHTASHFNASTVCIFAYA